MFSGNNYVTGVKLEAEFSHSRLMLAAPLEEGLECREILIPLNIRIAYDGTFDKFKAAIVNYLNATADLLSVTNGNSVGLDKKGEQRDISRFDKAGRPAVLGHDGLM